MALAFTDRALNKNYQRDHCVLCVSHLAREVVSEQGPWLGDAVLLLGGALEASAAAAPF